MKMTILEARRLAMRANAAGTVLGVCAMGCFALMLAYLNGAGWCAGSILSVIGAAVFGCGCADAFLIGTGYEIEAEKREARR